MRSLEVEGKSRESLDRYYFINFSQEVGEGTGLLESILHVGYEGYNLLQRVVTMTGHVVLLSQRLRLDEPPLRVHSPT